MAVDVDCTVDWIESHTKCKRLFAERHMMYATSTEYKAHAGYNSRVHADLPRTRALMTLTSTGYTKSPSAVTVTTFAGLLVFA